MKTYTILPGHSNFRPLENPLPIWKPAGFEVGFRFLRGGWCSLDDWDGDGDWGDWQKLKGLTRFFSLNNRQTAMIAFSFDAEPEHYRACAYTNDTKGGWLSSNHMKIEAGGDSGFARCVFDEKGYAHYTGSTEGGEYLNVKHGLKKFNLSREVGTFAGDSNNSPGPHGGRAIKKMEIEIDFKILKQW